LSLKAIILVSNGIEFSLELLDFFLALVLDPEVFKLAFDLSDSILQTTLLLDVGDKLIKVLLESINLLIDLSSNLVFLSFLEDELFDLAIDLLDACHDSFGFSLNVFNFLQYVSYFFLLHL
jgi:hypothetical protein